MRIRQISVTGLFGIFNHVIPLNSNPRVTIVHGPNGYGKTILLQMLWALMTARYRFLRRVPFASFTVDFDNGQNLEVRQGKEPVPTLIFQGLDQKPFERPPNILDFEEPADSVRIGINEAEWFKTLCKSVPVQFIRTQRLEVAGTKPTAQSYSEDLAERIKHALTQYATVSQEKDRTFPARLFEVARSPPLSPDDLRQKLAVLEDKRARLIELGFLSPESNPVQVPQSLDEKREILTIYVQDSEEKLSVFDDLVARIGLLTRTLNLLFRYKRLSISKAGFVITSSTGNSLTPANLSSGEQHELVLVYELLFKTPENTLVLLDEPEISLHLFWQQQFMSNLMEIAKLARFDVLVATHSPEIIGDYWDLTVELKGPADPATAADTHPALP